ncbi:DJ-1/PfpI family protein [Candidatus Enterococcus murrayae]|uniref:DJ-1/PfpI family protein n=1 Tax=Candidatus Enterococcus murrayae TaxID=2815321 RepID=A0ABS3HB80_9ENTE|nr:DJ-1/PfpI family protein [Enterococcus sp. MJM16]MBO0450714.1 DJ-1/PfpI family protein [Enterococcus sp. MJM16]
MKTALFVLLDQYADWEGAYLLSLLNQRNDWQIKTASNLPQVESIGGLQTVVDLKFSEINQRIDLLVLIGGNSWNIHSQELYRIIEKQLLHEMPVAAICGAVDYLARHGFLEEYKHTGNARAVLQAFPSYRTPENFYERQAVSDRNLVTANGTAALEFTEFVLQLIGDSLIQAKKEVDLYRLGYYGYREKYSDTFS